MPIETLASGGCAYAKDIAAPTVGRSNRSPIPIGDHHWELSWAVRESLMRWRHVPECCDLGDKEWRFREALGHIHCTGVNDVTHRMCLYGQASIQGDTLYVYRPSSEVVPRIPSGDYKPAKHWRLCANIHGNNWRLRDENSGELTMVDGYQGSLHLNYLDKGSHVFHTEDGVICQDRVFHFIDNSLPWEWEPPGTDHHCKG